MQSIGPSWIFFLNHACFLLVHYVHALPSIAHIRSNGLPPEKVVPDCSALEPPSCTNTYSTNPTTREYTFDYYLETCPSHQCTQITPVDNPSQEAEPAAAWKLVIFNTCTQPGSPPLPFDELYVPTSIMDTEDKFIRQSNFWFCNSTIVGYMARVETNTGLAPGLKEDQWAQCQWERTKNVVDLGDDVCLERYGGIYCKQAYKYYLCAIAFPKCQPATGGLTPTGTTDMYGPDSLSLLQQKNIMYTVTKPCRTLCYNLIRTCPRQLQFSCHLKESRDWADYPGCNVAGNPQGGSLYIK